MNHEVENLEALAMGAALFGVGGGGSPYLGYLAAKSAMEKHGPAQLLDVADVPDHFRVCSVAGYGAPTVGQEKLASYVDCAKALETLSELIGPFDAIVPAEVGGGNSMLPLAVGSYTGLPVINGDGMGRAFPELYMSSFSINGVSSTPLAIVDEHHNQVLVRMESEYQAEKLTRHTAMFMGLRCYIAAFSMSGADLKRVCVSNTLSIALEIGKILLDKKLASEYRLEKMYDYLESTEHYHHVRTLFTGKILDVDRTINKGFSTGSCTIVDAGEKNTLNVTFQNEYSSACLNGNMIAMTPDLIAIIDSATCQPLTVADIKYGQRVTVVGISAPAVLRTPEALAVCGPGAFGLDSDYCKLEDFPIDQIRSES